MITGSLWFARLVMEMLRVTIFAAVTGVASTTQVRLFLWQRVGASKTWLKKAAAIFVGAMACCSVKNAGRGTASS